jgi:hypothetical protein
MHPVRAVCGCGFVLLCGLIWWTQYLARLYGYHAALGTPLWTVPHVSRRYGASPYGFYWPWQGLVWQWRCGGVWWQVGFVGVSVGLVISMVVWLVWRQRHRPPRALPEPGAARLAIAHRQHIIK